MRYVCNRAPLAIRGELAIVLAHLEAQLVRLLLRCHLRRICCLHLLYCQSTQDFRELECLLLITLDKFCQQAQALQQPAEVHWASVMRSLRPGQCRGCANSEHPRRRHLALQLSGSGLELSSAVGLPISLDLRRLLLNARLQLCCLCGTKTF